MGLMDHVCDIGVHIWQLTEDQKRWSQDTFGKDVDSSPKDMLTILKGATERAIDCPHDPYKYAQCFLLVLDASRRAGISLEDLIKRSQAELAAMKAKAQSQPEEDHGHKNDVGAGGGTGSQGCCRGACSNTAAVERADFPP